jgi:hypothetical protein
MWLTTYKIWYQFRWSKFKDIESRHKKQIKIVSIVMSSLFSSKSCLTRSTIRTTAIPTASWSSEIIRRIGLGPESRKSSSPWRSWTLAVWLGATIPEPFTTDDGCRRNGEGFSKYGKLLLELTSRIRNPNNLRSLWKFVLDKKTFLQFDCDRYYVHKTWPLCDKWKVLNEIFETVNKHLYFWNVILNWRKRRFFQTWQKTNYQYNINCI